MKPHHYDVGVIGAGPAACITAFRLAQLSYSVLLIHKKTQDPDAARGIESLSMGGLRLLSELGLADRVESPGSGFRPWTFLKWGSDATESGPRGGLLVNRQMFDQHLLSAALAAGVHSYEGSIKGLSRPDGDENWSIRLDSGTEVTFSFLADASGRNNVLGGFKILHGPPTVALSAEWRGARCDTADSFIEAGESSWYWGARLPDGLARAIVFLDRPKDPSVLRSGGSRESFYGNLMSESTLFRAFLSAERSSPVSACHANVCADQSPVSRSHIKIGDASLTLDPLCSQGIQRAVASALQGSVVINTILRRPAAADQAIAFYRTRERESLREHRHSAAYFYKSSWRARTSFWKTRSAEDVVGEVGSQTELKTLSPSDFVLVASEGEIVDSAVIEGEFVVQGKALTHGVLSRPVAYVGKIPAVPLIESIGPGCSVEKLERMWHQFEAVDIRRCLSWMASRELIVVRPPHR